MPELPEVETVTRGLRAALVGRTITDGGVLWARSVVPPDPAIFIERLTGQNIASVSRRGKWIVLSLSSTDTLLIHLRMTGRLALETATCLDSRHLRVFFLLDDGQRLHFVDPRKFGRLVLTDKPGEILSKLGPEPLAQDLTTERFAEMLAARRGRIKPLLLNQRFLAGLGNIYTDEALWRAGIHPLRTANSLSRSEAGRLHANIQAVLRAGIESGGTTLNDGAFQSPEGHAGDFARNLAVYGRAGEPCPVCGTPITRTTVGQRGTHFCPSCQSSQE